MEEKELQEFQKLKQTFEKSGFNLNEPVEVGNQLRIEFGKTTPWGEEWKEVVLVDDLHEIPTIIDDILENTAEEALTESEQWKWDNLFELLKHLVNPDY